ncbi:DUF262 domain-containing protein [Brachyspira hampsonii]|uniref:DUF262 domain-containing protein n=1 Tax=Brachyspira hampsonii 30446 TaxID=1289135 RepID=A0A2U4F128_9SPIR|nr:DUF262 domain-containing protein [Brachyspira hampsonii]EKV57972.1 hypothetical protein A966_02546 [Brachyspira hampsonii 30446]MBW5391067.1 DUF262 domain-containing protein [Brachyspira hampsonii]MBW5395369.1 DUF262 domain-containing protein [Brachyspira hampsonii]
MYELSSKQFSLDKIIEEKQYFSIPIYQRLYVWKEEQILKLLQDIKIAIEDKKENYYIGSLIVLKSDNNRYDLIDGQQRFTTIFILFRTIQEIFEDRINEKNLLFIKNFLYGENNIRLLFRARKFADDFFKKVNIDNQDNSDEEKELLDPFYQAINVIRGFFEDINNNINLDNFIDFISTKLIFIITQMPRNTDVNKLFETFNNRGVQLKQHEILKAKLLEKIKNNRDKYIYSIIWDCCSIMDNYIEKNLKDILNIPWKKIINTSYIRTDSEREEEIPDNIEYVKYLIKSIDKDNNSDNYNLYEILDENNDFNFNKNEYDENEYEAPYIRSIISFPMLLLHTLRIYIIKNNIDIDIVDVKEKELINIFKKVFTKKSNGNDIKKFFKLLWKIRVRFDKYVVKWVYINDKEVLSISKIYCIKNNTSQVIQRRHNINSDGFSMLQMMLYHSQEYITQYWLTPFLKKMLNNNIDENILYKYLMKLDNLLYFYESDKNLSERTINMCSEKINKYYDKNIDTIKDRLIEELKMPKGLKFYRYWFYKLEFILWYYWNENNDFFEYKYSKLNEILLNFRITAKNSIEHVYPQNPENSPKWEDIYLHNFGNLVLISQGLNSEYSNKPYHEKLARFRTNLDRGNIESLKSLLILKNNKWDENACKEHLKEVIDLYVNYYTK